MAQWTLTGLDAASVRLLWQAGKRKNELSSSLKINSNHEKNNKLAAEKVQKTGRTDIFAS